MAESKENIAKGNDANNLIDKSLISETEDEICSDHTGSLSPNIDDSDITGR